MPFRDTLNISAITPAMLMTAALAWGGAVLIARHAAALGLVHAPSGRSLHNSATPHGGGLGMVVAFLCAVSFAPASALPITLYDVLLLGGGAVAALGLWDDITPLPAEFRLGVQALLVAGTVASIGRSSDWSAWLWWALAWLALLWWLNLFNFMDGIDGLAALEALFIALATIALLHWRSTEATAAATAPALALCYCLLGCSTAGFLVANWSPATIFMGDVGSTFLGFTLGALALAGSAWLDLPPALWLILGGVFWVDGTSTLLRRIHRGEGWRRAHRDHAYQRFASLLARRGEARGLPATAARAGAHRRVCLAVSLINGLWLLPWSALVIIAPPWLHPLIVAAALSPLVGVVFWRVAHD